MSVNIKRSIRDTFPFIENTIFILDKYFEWWKNNYKNLEQEIIEAINNIDENADVEIQSRFIIFEGNREDIPSVLWRGPAIELTLKGFNSFKIRELKETLENNEASWEGHRTFTNDNKLIIMFEIK
ncbi:MAG: hypothetical protein ACOC1K_06635 [Nanoarchaeota archaeon]